MVLCFIQLYTHHKALYTDLQYSAIFVVPDDGKPMARNKMIDLPVTLFDCLFLARKAKKMETWNHNTILFVLLKFGIDIFHSLEISAFRQCNNFGIFQQCFHHNFRLKWKFLILIIPSERSSLDLLQIRSIFFNDKNNFLG